MEDKKFFGADLHIHTPASKCYIGNNDDSEYIDILRRYFNKNIRIIAITDHNTLKGYKELMRIKEELTNKIITIKPFTDKIPDLLPEIKKLEDDLCLFKKILILPGIEFEANPGIHLLFVFDPKTDLKTIDDFLENSGYKIGIQGLENPKSVEINLDVLDALSKAKELNAITIAAHVDSDKGIYNDLSGQYRSRVFKSDYLDGISVNNVVQIEKINNLLKSPDYKRNKPLATIQSSDHHQKNQCGIHITYFQIEKLDFSHLAECFNNPIERISPTEKPEIKNILKRLANDKNTILVEDLDYDVIKKSACAVLNNNYGVILIGVTNDSYKNIKGINTDEVDINLIKESIISEIIPEKIFYSLKINTLPFGSKRIVIISFTNISNKDFYYNKIYYQMIEGKVIESSTSQVVEKKSNILRNELDNYLNSLDLRLKSINNELSILNESQVSFKIFEKINKDKINLINILSRELLYPSYDFEFKHKFPHGHYEKKVFLVDASRPRYEDCYLRCSCVSTNEIEYDPEKVQKGLKLVLVPEGGTYIINEESWNIYNTDTKLPAILLGLYEEFNNLNLYSVLAWLKSSILLWYNYTRYGNIDLHEPKAFKGMPIPTVLFYNDTSLILEEKIKQILNLETEYLREHVRTYDELKDDLKAINKLADEHNRKIDLVASEIEEVIADALEIDKDEQLIIKNFLLLKNLHDFTI